MAGVLEKLLVAAESDSEARLLESDLQHWVTQLSPTAVFLPTAVFHSRVLPAFRDGGGTPPPVELVPANAQWLAFSLRFANGVTVLWLAERGQTKLEEVNNIAELCRDEDTDVYRRAAAWFTRAALNTYVRPVHVNPHPHLLLESNPKRCSLAILLYTYIRLRHQQRGLAAQKLFAQLIGGFERETLVPAARRLRTAQLAKQQRQQLENLNVGF
jgi:hypothetical protein